MRKTGSREKSCSCQRLWRPWWNCTSAEEDGVNRSQNEKAQRSKSKRKILLERRKKTCLLSADTQISQSGVHIGQYSHFFRLQSADESLTASRHFDPLWYDYVVVEVEKKMKLKGAPGCEWLQLLLKEREQTAFGDQTFSSKRPVYLQEEKK